MSFTWGEISKWAKSHGYKVSKKDGLFLWNHIESPDINGSESNLEKMIRAVYNKITSNKWIDHQKEYDEKH